VTRAVRVGVLLLAAIAVLTIAAPVLAPHDPAAQFLEYVSAPPMRPRLIDADGRWRAPFVYPLRLEDRLQGRFAQDRSQRMPLRLFGPSLVAAEERPGESPWLLLGSDPLGRDVFARLLLGARVSLGVSACAAIAALALGALLGGVAGFVGGRVDTLLMRAADFVLVLPVLYVVLALRAAMPLVMSASDVFWTLVVVLALAGWPYPARGVRAIVASERRKEYAEAARAIGAGPWRILRRHVLPATGGFLAVQATLLLPAFVLAEATLSYVGLGFPNTTPSWGVMLQDAARVAALSQAPWLLAPAGAIVLTVLAVHLSAAHVGADRARVTF
jgi:peptide/nickel transport system permease protein